MDFIDLFPFIHEVGYVGLGIISFFGSLIPFIPIPYFLLLVTMSTGPYFDLNTLAILSAITSTIAKQIIFYASYGGRQIINKRIRKRMKPFERLVKRYGAATALVAAATPIPDDLIYIPLGLARYNPVRFFLATFIGKLVLNYVVVLISHFFGFSILDPIIGDVNNVNAIYIGLIIFMAVLIFFIILILKLDWSKILGKIAPWTLDDDKK